MRPTHWLISTRFFQDAYTTSIRLHHVTPAGHGPRGAVRLRYITDGCRCRAKAAPVVPLVTLLLALVGGSFAFFQ